MNIYVGNLSLEATEEELLREFMPFGAVESVVIMNDKYISSGQSRGYGFIEMPKKSEAEAAIAGLKGKRIKGMVIDTVEALPLSDKPYVSPFRTKINNHSKKVRQRKMLNSQ